MEATDRSPEDVFAELDETSRATMTAVDAVIVEVMPGRSRRVWEGVFWGGTDQTIIGYGDIVQPRPRGTDVEWFLVGLARQKQHFSLYVNAVADGAYLGRQYADRLGKVRAGSASIAFKRLDDLDLDVLGELCGHADRITP